MTAQTTDPFAFFAPTLAWEAGERLALARGDAATRVLAGDAADVAMAAAVGVDADAERVLAWMRAIERLKKSPYVLATGRFSVVPTLSDLDGFALEEDDLQALRVCRVGNCAVKLAEAEMVRLRRVANQPGDWRGATQAEAKAVFVERARSYLSNGAAALAPLRDGSEPVVLRDQFEGLLTRTPFLAREVPALADWLRRFPDGGRGGERESFLYWSKEKVGGKATFTVTHVALTRGDGSRTPEVLVVGRQVFATHYMNGSLSITALVRDPSDARRYLVYLNRSRVDVLSRWFGGLVRTVVDRRVRGEAAEILLMLKRRLESGPPGRVTLTQPPT